MAWAGARRAALVLSLLAGLGLALAQVHERAERRQGTLPFGVEYDQQEQTVSIQDFGMLIAYTRDVLRGRLPEPYAPATHLRFMKAWTGNAVDFALPFAYTPILWLVLAPLTLVGARTAYLLWTLLALGAVGALALRGVRRRGLRADEAGAWMLAAALASGTLLFSLDVGQTSIWACVLVALLLGLGPPAGPVGEGVLFLLACSKPTLGLTLAIGLLAGRRWRSLAIGVGLVALVLGIATVAIGPSWIRDYLQLTSSYLRMGTPDIFAWAIEPTEMTNVRHALLLLGAGEGLATSASMLVWLGGLAGVAALARDARTSLEGALLAFLIGCPHLTFSDDLLIAVVALSRWGGRDMREGEPFLATLLTAGVLWVGLKKSVLLTLVGTFLAFAFKVALALVWLRAVRREAGAAATAERRRAPSPAPSP